MGKTNEAPSWAQDLEKRVDVLLENQKPTEKKEPEKKESDKSDIDKQISDWSGSSTEKGKPGRPSTVDADIAEWAAKKSK